MPVSVITDVVTWIEMIAQIGVSTLELGVMSYLVFGGGWLDMIRLIAFWLDNMIIKYTDVFYSYFEKILAGKIFAPDVVDGVMTKVYVFVSLIVLLKIMMLFIKYLINPEMVSDDKIGTHALVKRVLLGMSGMIALPYIFSFSVDVQEAVLNDNLFGQILLTKKELRTFEKNKGQVGRVLAFNVYQAFWNLDTSRVTSSSIKKEYNNAITAKDPGVIGSINEKFGEDYAYDYFPIASTVVLLYVIYLIIKYCLDVVVRMFKLFLLQMLGPLAISDYMINGDSKGVFKNWLNTTISVYAMLFVRIFSIWFIAFITILMQKECTTAGADGICTDSLLYVVKGQDPDYLLRGIITLGLLALLMDLPKFFSDILGLDLEQDATVKGLMQKVGGAAKMVGLGAAATGGAALGGAIGGLKNAASAGRGLAANKMENKGKLDGKLDANQKAYNRRLQQIQNNKGLNAQQKKDAEAQALANKNAADQKAQSEYKAANSTANKQAAAQFTNAAMGAGVGAFAAMTSAIPGLKEVSSGYNQGRGATDSSQKELDRVYGENEKSNSAYGSAKDSAAQKAVAALQEEQLEFEATIRTKEIDAMDAVVNVEAVMNQQIANKVLEDATAAGAEQASEVTKTVKLVADSSGLSGALDSTPIEKTVTLTADASGLSGALDSMPTEKTVTLTADASGLSGALDSAPTEKTVTLTADTSGLSGALDSTPTEKTVTLVGDTSGVEVGEVKLQTNIETPQIEDTTATLDVSVTKKVSDQEEFSAFDDKFMDGSLDG